MYPACALAYPLLLLPSAGRHSPAAVFRRRGGADADGARPALALAAYSREILLLPHCLYGHWRVALPQRTGIFPLALLEIALLFIVSFLGAQIGAASLLPLTRAAARRPRARVRARRIVLHAPPFWRQRRYALSAQVSPELNQLTQRVRRMLDDYLFFATRQPLLSATGDQPLGISLAGPTNRRAPAIAPRGARCFAARSKANTTDTLGDSTSGGAICMSTALLRTPRDLFIKASERCDSRATPPGKLSPMLMRADAAAHSTSPRFSALGMKSCRIFPRQRGFGTRGSPSATATRSGFV
ncbi:MAG: hypothetical protein ACLUI3_04800 [Christensenellales bacterium]